MNALRILLGPVVALALSCSVRSVGESPDAPGASAGGGESPGGNEPTCAPLGTSCASSCDAIQARGVDTSTSATRRCRGVKSTLGCYHRPDNEIEREACVVDSEGQAFATSPSAEDHLTQHGYRACSGAEQELWTSAEDCD